MVKNKHRQICVPMNNVGRDIFIQTVKLLSRYKEFMNTILPDITSYKLYIEYNQEINESTKTDFICEYCQTSSSCFVELVLHYYTSHPVRSYYLIYEIPYLFILQDTHPADKSFYYKSLQSYTEIISTTLNSFSLKCKHNKSVTRYIHTHYNLKPLETLQSTKKQHKKMKQDRVFYHSLTNEPYLLDEDSLQRTIDSEEELDNDWIIEIEDKEIDGFTDVSDADKEFFKLWNAFIHPSYQVASDCMMLEACSRFLEKLHKERRVDMYKDSFIMHLITLWQSNIITGDEMFLLRLVRDM